MKTLRKLALLGASALAATSVHADDTKPVRIGALVSVSGSGAANGAMAMAGWKLAIDELNAAGGIAGRKFELVSGDTQTDPTHAVAEARRLVENEKVDAFVGPATSQEAIPILGVTTEKAIVQISTAASTQLTPEFAPYHFSTSPLGANQMIPNIDYALDVMKLTKLALISDNGGASKAGVQDALIYLKSRGVEPVAVQEFAFKSEDLTPQLFSMRSAGAEAVILINSIYDDSRRLLQNRDEIGWDVPVMGTITTTSNAKTIAAVAGEEIFANVYGTQFIGLTYCDGDPEGQSEFARYAERARRALPEIDRLGGPASVAMFYIQPMVIAAAIAGSGSTEGKAMADWLAAQPAIDTVLGPVRATADSHFLPDLASVTVVQTPHKVRADGTFLRADCKVGG